MTQNSKIRKRQKIWQIILTEIVQPVCNCQQHVDLTKYMSETAQVTPVCYLPASTAILSPQIIAITYKKK